MLRRCALLIAVVCAPLVAQSPAPGSLGFYRYPALSGRTIVFAAEGDLWSVPITGGLAHRLTSHAAEESDPTISPDGSTLAFTARYEGPAAIYTMPLTGGSPTRWTYDADAAIATTWTPDGQLVYRTLQYSSIPKLGMVKLNVRDGTRALVPLAGASEGSYDATGKTIYFVRPGFHNNVTKRYTGGTARQIWKYTDGAAEAVQLTGQDYNGESHSPMWHNGRVYYVTDKDGQMNIWSMKDDGSDKKQVTRHIGWDVRDPSLADGKVVYQLGADLWLLDVATAQTRMVPVTITSDLDQLRENWVNDPQNYISASHLSPDGDRVVLTARGRMFIAPVKAGRFVRASRKDSVRFRDAVFSSDGKSLIALSDETGELEWVRVPANGVGADEALTRNGNIFRYNGRPSPDGRSLAWADNNNDLWVLNLATRETKKVSENREGIGNMSWSPDGRFLAYVMTASNTFQQIKIYSVESGRSVALTSERTNSFAPAWDTKGEFIYFLSDRNLRSLVGSPWGNRRPEPYFDKEIEIYQVALRPGLRSPFLPDDELRRAETTRRPDSTSKAPISIDTAGLALRIRRVPVPSGNYNWLAVNGDALFYTAAASGANAQTDLTALKIGNDKPEPVVLVDGIRGAAEMSANGKKILVRKGANMHVVDARPMKVANVNDTRVDLTGWTFNIDVKNDFRQMFVDAWRMERDNFYDPSLHGVDYKSTLAKYGSLLPRITTRAELNDLIGWAVGELSALHTAVRGGDQRAGEDQIQVASLGARLFRDQARGGYRIDYIYRSDPDYPAERSPLADPELGVKAGDVITAVNGVATLSTRDIGELLRNQGGKQVLLSVASAGQPSRDVVVEAAASEANLRYADWEYTRRLETEKKGDGKIGYLHLRAMGTNDMNQFVREFTPVFDKQGLILDMRQNRGGNIDSWVLTTLMRKPWMYWKGRVGEPYWNMQGAPRGHLVMLVDAETASDGEAVADGFRRLGLGVVIGMRTWGGEIWLSDNTTLSDGGLARAPQNGVYGPEGKWLIEQEGVHPDMVVDNLPHATFLGQDAQLDAAIAYLKKKIAEDPREVPKPPPYPKKSVKVLP
jgi:tricorn protease